jgi:23S rRNA (cytidine1920-2'-O)/16S rRNA (cytidine1409-2'-O)-methyltransferase
MPKIRLDELVLRHNFADDKARAQALIMAGLVEVNGQRQDKPGSMFDSTCQLAVKEKCPYVSRGGLKLAKGLEFFKINPKNFICADIGASTGGFTDCLLQNGAAKVFAVDVGYGQLAWKLRQDKRVVVMERTNARKLTKADLHDQTTQPHDDHDQSCAIDLAVIDAAFISLKLLIPPLLPLFDEKLAILALIKPQFEVAKGLIGKGGVVRDPALHDQVIEDIGNFVASLGLASHGVTSSPILGPKGNKEFLIYLTQ